MKRLSILIAILLLVVIAGSYWFYGSLEKREQASLYDALPPSATFFMETSDLPELKERFENTEYFNVLSNTSAIAKFLRETETMNKMLAEPDSGVGLFENRKILIPVALTNAGEFGFLYLLETKNLDKSTFDSFINDFQSVRKTEKRNYKGVSIYESVTGQGTLTLAFHRGIIIVAFTPFLVEEAIVQLQSDSWINKDEHFQSIQSVSSNNSDALSIYFKLADEALITELMIDQENADLKEFIRNFSSWVQLELSFDKAGIVFNGYTVSDDGQFLSQFKGEKPGNAEITRILPINTAVYTNIHAPLKTESSPNDSVEFSSYFNNWVGSSRGFAILETFDKNWAEALVYFTECSDVQRATESLAEIAKLQNQDYEQDYNGYKIGQLSGSHYPEIFSLPNIGLSDPYYTMIGEYLLMANSADELKKLISKYLNGSTLSRSSDFLSFNNKLSSNSNFILHVQPTYSIQLFSSILNASLSKSILDSEADWVKFRNFALQFSNYNDLFFTNAMLEFSNRKIEKGPSKEQLWATELDAALSRGPFMVKNHNSGAREIFVQDSKNNIYLVDRNGKILWKKSIDGQIMGDEVYQIDYYKNGKLQMVFNTEANIYIVDRESNNVAGFPLKLPVNASNPILVTNYDNKHVYRYFMAGRNRIYGFYQSGKPLPGWSPKPRAGTITQVMDYCQIKGVDYIIAVNEEGELFYFDRRGDKKVDPILTKTKFEFEFSFVKYASKFELYNLSKAKNQLYTIDMKGAFSKANMSDTLSFFDFSAFDLDKDGHAEMVFTDSSTIYIYDSDLKLLESISSPIKIDQKPFLVGANKLGFYSKKSNEVYLIDEHYTSSELFPLESHSVFLLEDLYKNGNDILIGTDKENRLSAWQVDLN